MKLGIFQIILITTVLSINFQNCASPNPEDTISDESTTKTEVDVKKIDDSDMPLPDPEISENKKENILDNNDTSELSDIQFIRDKYAIITNIDSYKIDSFAVECSGGIVELKRRYNEKGEVSYLRYEACGDHGCHAFSHYFWDGKLIFLFEQNSYWVGNTDNLSEYRTYFKDDQMILCLAKEATSTNNLPQVEDLLKKTPNSEVDCKPDKFPRDLEEMKALNQTTAEQYLCQ